MPALTQLCNFKPEILKIILDLENRADKKSSFGETILFLIESKRDHEEIIEFIKSNLEDGNRMNVELCIGEELTKRIENIILSD